MGAALGMATSLAGGILALAPPPALGQWGFSICGPGDWLCLLPLICYIL